MRRARAGSLVGGGQHLHVDRGAGVDAVGASSLAAGHKTLLPTLVNALKEQGSDDIIVFAGGVIPAQDYDTLYKAGAKAIFGPGTRIEDSARTVLTEIRKALAK